MHPHGNLGPVDPQIQTIRKGEGGQAEQLQFGAEDLSSFLRFTREAVGLTDQNHLAQMFELFCKDVGSVQIGIASRSSQLSIMMSKKLLKMHMKGADQSQQAATIAESLNKNFFHHGYPVSRSEAKDCTMLVPPFGLQRRFSTIIARVRETMNTTMTSTQTSRDLSDSLMVRLLDLRDLWN